MAVSSTTNKVSYNGDGSTATFSYTFKIFANADLQVTIRDANGTETTQTLDTEYIVTGAGSASGGNVTFKYNTGNSSDPEYSTTDYRPATGETVTIKRVVTLTQGTDYVENDPFPAQSHEDALDRLTFIQQQQQEEIDRSIKASVTNTLTTPEFTISAADRANKIFAFDSSGNLSIAQELGTFRGDWSASVAYNQRDIVKDTNNNNIYIANTAHTSSGTVPLSTNTDSAKWDLIVDAAAATTSASTASDHRADAGKYAVTAHNTTFTLTATNGSTSGLYSSLHYATESSNSASAASTSEANAATSETNAQDWATKTNGIVDSVGYSAKAWSIGGTGVTNTAGSGAAQEWATKTTANVDGTEYSAKEYAIGTQIRGTTGSAKDWASYTAGTVDGSEYSAKYWAQQAASETQSQRDVYYGAFANDAAAQTWQTGTNGGTVDAGDQYFNTSSNIIRVYDGTAWNDAVVSTTGFATNGFAIAMAIAL